MAEMITHRRLAELAEQGNIRRADLQALAGGGYRLFVQVGNERLLLNSGRAEKEPHAYSDEPEVFRSLDRAAEHLQKLGLEAFSVWLEEPRF